MCVLSLYCTLKGLVCQRLAVVYTHLHLLILHLQQHYYSFCSQNHSDAISCWTDGASLESFHVWSIWTFADGEGVHWELQGITQLGVCVGRCVCEGETSMHKYTHTYVSKQVNCMLCRAELIQYKPVLGTLLNFYLQEMRKNKPKQTKQALHCSLV